MYATARRFHALGISTVPPRDDGSKSPVGEWKAFMERLPTDEELLAWHQAGTSGLGIVTGRTDRDDGCGIEMFEPEGRAVAEGVFEEFLGRIAEAGLTECWERIAAGYHEKTPGGGTHYYWLCAEYSGNIKLASRLATPEELAEKPDDKYKTLLETRGKGGYSVAAPTPGSFHESGRPWTSGLLPETLAVITPGQREEILGCARACSRVPKGAVHERPERTKHETLSGPDRSPAGVPLRTRPGDVYNRRGPDWAEILEPHGWRMAGEEADGTRHWTRPGKAGGTSATTGNPQHEGDKLHVFTSSTEFEPDCSYSKFAVFAILEHDGDWSAAAAQLVRDGYVSDEEGHEKPTLDKAVYHFEGVCDLRRATTGEFVARPRDPDKPPLVTEIGDELGFDVKWWWRQAAEAWNEDVDRRKREKAEKAAEEEAAEQARLESLSEQERAAAEQAQMEETKEAIGKIFSEPPKPPDEDGEEDKKVNAFPGASLFSTILDHLKVSANQHERIALHMRVMDEPERLVVDLCDDAGRVVVITEYGWQVCDLREVPGEPWFRRGKHMAPQATPTEPGDVLAVLKEAQAVIGMDDEQWPIALGGLIGGHFPSIDRPGWWLTGPSGAGKTTRGRMLANWLDPARHLGGRINLKRDERDARTKAMNRYVFTQDNISGVTQDESDFWCTLHTGASDEVRQLHSDNTMLSFEYKRIGLGTSVNMPTGFQPDALRRMLHIELEASDDHPDAGALWKTYEDIRPRVLGALYCVLSGVLKHLGDAMAADLPECPEMSAYARRLYAADLA